MTPAALRWSGDAAGSLELLDQTLLPGRVNWIACRNVPIVVEAIRSLRVRGAPAIGIAGGYGTVLAAAEATRLALSPATALAHVRARAAAATARSSPPPRPRGSRSPPRPPLPTCGPAPQNSPPPGRPR